jgi:thymidylate kinase
MSNKKRIVCITGGDGAGKSTLVNAVAASRPEAHVAGIWDAQEGAARLFSSKKEIDGYLCSLTPDSRLLFLAHALHYSTELALQSDRDLIIFNGYWYKYFATERAGGASSSLARSLAGLFPVPHLTIRLALSPEERGARKTVFSRYECGCSETPAPTDFIAFQTAAEPHWNEWETATWTTLDARRSPQALLDQTLQLMNRL